MMWDEQQSGGGGFRKRVREESGEMQVGPDGDFCVQSATPKAIKRPRRELSHGIARRSLSASTCLTLDAGTSRLCPSPSPSGLSLQTQEGDCRMSEGASPASCHSHRSSVLSPRRTLKYRTSPSRSVGSMQRDSPLQRCLTQMGKTGQSIDTIDGLPRSQNDTVCRVDLRRAALLRSILQKRDSISPGEDKAQDSPITPAVPRKDQEEGGSQREATSNPYASCRGSKKLISDSVDAHLGAAFLNLGFSSPAWNKKAASRLAGRYSAPEHGRRFEDRP